MSNAQQVTVGKRPFYVAIHEYNNGQTLYPIVMAEGELDLETAIEAIEKFQPGNLELDREDEDLIIDGPFKTLYFIPKEGA